MMLYSELNIKESKALLDDVLTNLYLLEDNTNYDIKALARAVNILQGINLDEEYKKYNVEA